MAGDAAAVPPPFDAVRAAGLVAGHGHNAALGIRSVAHGPDWAEFALPFDPRLIGDADRRGIGTGPVFSLLDMAASIAIWSRCGRFVPVATLDLRIDRLRGAIDGRDIMGHAECHAITARIAFVRGRAHDGDPDDPIATMAATFMLTDSR